MSGNTTDLSAIHALISDKKPPDKATISSPSLEFDIEKYLAAFECEHMTEDEAKAVLGVLWDMMCRFVELGLGIDAGSINCEQDPDDARIPDEILLDYTDTQNE